MAAQRPADSPVEAFINQDPHCESASNGFKHLEFARLDNGDDLFSFDCWKGIEKILDRFATFKIINEVLKRNARADEYRRPAHDVPVGVNNALEFFRAHRFNIPKLINFDDDPSL